MQGDDFLAEIEEIAVVLAMLVLGVEVLPGVLVIRIETNNLFDKGEMIESLGVIVRGQFQESPGLPRRRATADDPLTKSDKGRLATFLDASLPQFCPRFLLVRTDLDCVLISLDEPIG